MSLFDTLVAAIRHPWQIHFGAVFGYIWTRVIKLSFLEALHWDKLERTWLAYGVLQAALEAKALGIPAITVVEFGIAGGNGLVLLEHYAEHVEKATGVRVHVVGFDRAEGLPKAVDYRDMPYIWQPGFFRMDVDALRKRLRRAEMILGDVAQTLPEFIAKGNAPPIGFVSFDLDFYSSTMEALRLFEQPVDRLLPRVFCYFDDCIGDDFELHSQFTGELLAISEFNEAHPMRKIAPIYGLSYKRRHPAGWNAMMFVMHCFEHPRYNEHVHPNRDWHLRLRHRDD
jgi:hypothetical protein